MTNLVIRAGDAADNKPGLQVNRSTHFLDSKEKAKQFKRKTSRADPENSERGSRVPPPPTHANVNVSKTFENARKKGRPRPPSPSPKSAYGLRSSINTVSLTHKLDMHTCY